MENLIGQALEAIASMGLLVLLIGFIAFTFAGVVAKQIVKFLIYIAGRTVSYLALHIFLLAWIIHAQKTHLELAWSN